MMRFLTWAGGVALVLVALLLTALFTQWGSQGVLRGVQWLVPGELDYDGFQGRLGARGYLRGVVYRGPEIRLDVGELRWDWRPGALIRARLHVKNLEINDVRLMLPSATPAEEDPPRTEPAVLPSLPLAIDLERLAMSRISVFRGEQEPVIVDDIALALRGRGRTMTVHRLAVESPILRLRGQGTITLAQRGRTDFRLEWEFHGDGMQAWGGQAQLQGDLRRLELTHDLTQPVHAGVKATFRDLRESPRWVWSLDMPAVTAREIHEGLPPGRLRLTGQGTGSLNATAGEFHVDFTTEGGTRQDARLAFRARETAGRWHLEPLRVTGPRPGAEFAIRGEWSPEGEGRFAVSARWRDWAWPPAGDPAVHSPWGGLDVQGRIADYQARGVVSIEGAEIPPGTWRWWGQGDGQAFTLDALHGAVLGGDITAAAQLQWKPHLQWVAAMAARGIDPGRHWPDWEGNLGARVGVLGDAQKGQWALRIKQVSGQLRGYPVTATADLSGSGTGFSVASLVLGSGDAKFTLQGRYRDTADLHWSLDVPALEMINPQGRGRLTARGTLSGPRERPRVDARMQGQGLQWSQWRLAELQGDVAVGLDPAAPMEGDVSFTGLTGPARSWGNIVLSLSGTGADHRLGLRIDGAVLSAAASLQGGVTGKGWQGRLMAARIAGIPGEPWSLTGPADLGWADPALSLGDLCMATGVAPGTGELCVAFHRGDDGRWEGASRARGLPLSMVSGYLPVGVAVSADAGWSFQAQGTVATGLAAAQGDWTVSGGQLRFAAMDEETRLQFGGGTGSVRLDDQGLAGETRWRLVGEDWLESAIRLPEFGPHPLAEQPVTGSIRGNLDELAFIESLSPHVHDLGGHIDLDLQVTGTAAQPTLTGSGRLQDMRAGVPLLALALTDGEGVIHARGTGGLTAGLSVASGGGQLSMQGQLQGMGPGTLEGTLEISGRDFLVADLPDARIRISPQLTVTVNKEVLQVQGEIKVPVARLRPPEVNLAVPPSRDVRLVQAESEDGTTGGLPMEARVKLILGDDVRFTGFGLDARLAGSLEITELPGKVTVGDGQLSVAEGTYKAYGQELAIDRGKLLFAGTPVDNPGLDVRASRKIGEVSAGIAVSGTLAAPELDLFSSPTMAQSDILSYLLFGRPFNRASSEEGASLFQAATALGLAGGESLAQQIGGTVGFEEVRIEGSGAQEDAALVLGRYLSPKLYISYGVGLFEAVSQLKMRYELSRRWTVESEAGEEVGGDLLWTLER